MLNSHVLLILGEKSSPESEVVQCINKDQFKDNLTKNKNAFP